MFLWQQVLGGLGITDRPVREILFFFVLSLLGPRLHAQAVIPDAVLDIFDDRCAFAGCHAGADAPRELDLLDDFVASSLINRPSKDKPGAILVKPGDPVNSYLVMKLKGLPAIAGDRMPRGGDPLSDEEIGAIESWIGSLPPTAAPVQPPEREFAQAFPGMSLATLSTTQTLQPGTFSYRIAHRWWGAVDNGFNQFFGLDAGAHMLTQLDFALSRDLTVSVARSGEGATFEFAGKWRALREKSDGSMPISLALRAGLDWETLQGLPDPNNPTSGATLSWTNSERFHWFLQAAASKKLNERFSVLFVPGLLLNGNVSLPDEATLVTLGLAGKLMVAQDFSLFVEAVPIVSGAGDAATLGGPRVEDGEIRINDAFTIGLERRVGGHVFHVYVTNSLGLATNQYMSGGNFDFAGGDFRLGFNIYRVLRFPF